MAHCMAAKQLKPPSRLRPNLPSLQLALAERLAELMNQLPEEASGGGRSAALPASRQLNILVRPCGSTTLMSCTSTCLLAGRMDVLRHLPAHHAA